MSIIQEALKKAQNYIGENRKSALDSFPESPRASQRGPGPNIILVVILFVTLAFVLKGFLPEIKFKKEAALKKAVEVEDPKAHQEVAYKPLRPAIESKAQDVKLDVSPTQIRHEIKPQYPELVLNGIMYLAERPQAIINNSVVEEGDTVSGAKVLSIKKNTVILNFNDVEISLSLKK